MNYARGIVRFYESEMPDEGDLPTEVLAFTAWPPHDQMDTEGVTIDMRRWLLDGRHTHFLFEERRKYSDVGAEGSSARVPASAPRS